MTDDMPTETQSRGCLQRLVMRLAHIAGLEVIPTTQISEWAFEATERCKIAGDYDLSDPRLSGKNDGRSETLNRVVHTVMDWNR